MLSLQREKNAVVAKRNAAESSLLSARDAMELMHVTKDVHHDFVMKQLEDAKVEITALKDMHQKSEQCYGAVVVEKNEVVTELTAKKEMIKVYEQRLTSLNKKVSQLDIKALCVCGNSGSSTTIY
jgi:hypothetical protein